MMLVKERMPDLEGKIASYLQGCRELAGLAERNGCWLADSIAFDILQAETRNVVIAVRFIEVMQDMPGVSMERVDRYGRLTLELDEFGEILSAYVC